MSGVTGKIGEFFGLKPKKAKVPKPPTIDTAKQNREEFDRLRRRRGVLANFFSRAASSSPTVGVNQLLGE